MHDVSYSLKSEDTSSKIFDFFNALGSVAFAYAGHNVVLEIQATIPSTPEKPSTKPMHKGVFVAYLLVGFCYFPVAFIGYYIFGNALDDNILLTLEKPTWLIATANMFVVVHVLGGYQVTVHFRFSALALFFYNILFTSSDQSEFFFSLNCHRFSRCLFLIWPRHSWWSIWNLNLVPFFV